MSHDTTSSRRSIHDRQQRQTAAEARTPLFRMPGGVPFRWGTADEVAAAYADARSQR